MRYTISWQQTYNNWEPFELPIRDLSQATALLSRIMQL